MPVGYRDITLPTREIEGVIDAIKGGLRIEAEKKIEEWIKDELVPELTRMATTAANKVRVHMERASGGLFDEIKIVIRLPEQETTDGN